MDKLVNKHHRSLKLLEKTLDEISAHKRQAEAKLNKQCRELGLDLTQLQRSYRDLDDMQDMTQRLSSRRGSLPQIDEFSKSPRSQRRLSIAAIPVTPTHNKTKQDSDNKRKNSIGAIKKQGAAPEINKSVPPMETQNNPRKSNSVTSEKKVIPTNGVGIIKQQVLPKIDKQNQEDFGSDKGNKQRSATVLFNNEDCASTISNGGKAVAGTGRSNGGAVVAKNSGNAVVMVYEEDREGEEEERLRLLSLSRGRTRRSSEPTISKQYLDALQNGVDEDGTKARGDNDKLKQITLTNHHLDAVSEQDETEFEVTAQKETAKTQKAEQNFHNGPPTSQGQGYSRQRRKSEGDILKWTQQLGRQQGSRGDRKGNGYQIEPANNEVWDSVRKCRYIRGYDPPEMVQPADVSKFVFGNGK